MINNTNNYIKMMSYLSLAILIQFCDVHSLYFKPTKLNLRKSLNYQNLINQSCFISAFHGEECKGAKVVILIRYQNFSKPIIQALTVQYTK